MWVVGLKSPGGIMGGGHPGILRGRAGRCVGVQISGLEASPWPLLWAAAHPVWCTQDYCFPGFTPWCGQEKTLRKRVSGLRKGSTSGMAGKVGFEFWVCHHPSVRW